MSKKNKKRFQKDLEQLEQLRAERETLIDSVEELDVLDERYEATNKRIREITETITIMEKTISQEKESKMTRGEKIANIVKYGAIVGLAAFGLKNSLTIDNNWDAKENKQTNNFSKGLFSNLMR